MGTIQYTITWGTTTSTAHPRINHHHTLPLEAFSAPDRPTHRSPGDTMDALVARYSRPSHQESTSEDQQQALADYAPSLSLNFALPPVASSAPWPTTAATLNVPSRSPTEPRPWPSDSRAASSW